LCAGAVGLCAGVVVLCAGAVGLCAGAVGLCAGVVVFYIFIFLLYMSGGEIRDDVLHQRGENDFSTLFESRLITLCQCHSVNTVTQSQSKCV
jgi:hypothetical protein